MVFENRFRGWVQRLIMLAESALSEVLDVKLYYCSQLDNESKTFQTRCMSCVWKPAGGSSLVQALWKKAEGRIETQLTSETLCW